MSSLNTTKYRLISLDLDDTLLTSTKSISKFTITTLQRLQEMGIIVVLNSGRFYHEIESYAKQLDLAKYQGYVVSANGHCIHNMRTQKRYEFPFIEEEIVHRCIEIAQKHHLVCYFHDGINYHTYANLWYRCLFLFAKQVGGLLRSFLHVPSTLFIWKPTAYPKQDYGSLEKLCLIGLPHQLHRYEKQLTVIAPDYHTFHLNPFSIEIVHQTVSKKDAIEKICQLHGFTLNQVIAFGDAGNDISLLNHAGRGYAMKNAHKSIKQQCDYITEATNNEDGVAKELINIF